ncbi:Rpn family recombination-promoting nuclease/putative transposase [Microscilla marina]|uniref:Rpn family recombination-promoting nuclease/putative transposase n=1 Tax=Microscilla marina ATCC 23134 TaxID=313606 RepID=A1ZWG5_MICM2|nr:Rpn family recombination-promoting nuclease/putative transposase [Microscilla marina]EAY25305.1 conserved hypothetical protein [Microscilla marina ATCC 23134]
MEKFINPFTDFGFKKLFGEEVNKDLLIDFLNELLRGEQTIKSLNYLKNEHLSSAPGDRKAIFDLYCENEQGEKFIVELQKVKQKYFKDRSIYYATFPVQEQAKSGDWNFQLNAVYTVAIMDFVFDDIQSNIFHHQVKLVDLATQQVFYDKLQFIYLEMPKFNKTEDELQSHYDKWMYLLKNLNKLQQRPQALQEKVFQKLFNAAEIALFDKNERFAYEDSLKYYRDLKNSLDTAWEEGLEKGREEGLELGEKRAKVQTALKMKKAGLSLEEISQFTGLSIEQIRQLV